VRRKIRFRLLPLPDRRAPCWTRCFLLSPQVTWPKIAPPPLALTWPGSQVPEVAIPRSEQALAAHEIAVAIARQEEGARQGDASRAERLRERWVRATPDVCVEVEKLAARCSPRATRFTSMVEPRAALGSLSIKPLLFCAADFRL